MASAFATIVFYPEVPNWRSSGTASIQPELVGYGSIPSRCAGDGQTIILRGDSLVLGDQAKFGLPYGKVAEAAIGDNIRILLHGEGGATAETGFFKWQRTAPRGAMVIIAYGTNDAATRGWLGGRSSTPLAEFEENLHRHIIDITEAGSEVLLLAPPPVGSAAMSERLRPYRNAVRAVGMATGTPVLDPAEAFASCASREPLLSWDALHLNSAGHQCLGKWLAKRICPATSG